jgi:phospholipid/cholesterol/gamma-HCH transport system ATP-binding protein
MSENSPASVIELSGVDIAAMKDTSELMFGDVNWSVLPGEFWTVAGAEQSGKTDFLLLMAGLMTPARGSYKLFGIETRTFGEAELPVRLRVGYVFEGGPLFNSLTITENLALPLRYQKNLTAADVAAPVAKLLAMMELEPFADLRPVDVPVAWRYRAALARALILKPEVLLLDNPTAGMAAKHRQWLVQFLDQIWRGHEWFDGQPVTMVVTTDDLRPWQNSQRKFALLEDQKFIPLGHWRDVEAAGHQTVKELLAIPAPLTA